jgi:two-component system, NarL family, response regulator LiaR
MISVFIVDDIQEHQLYLKTILESNAEMKFLGASATGKEAINAILQLRPDIVLMDIGLPDISGIECIRSLKPMCPEVQFMICTVHEEDSNIFEALKAGANGYILKKSKGYQVIDAIKDVYNGHMPISSSIARNILNHLPQTDDEKKKPTDYHITPKEAKILNLLAKGKSYQEISDALFISIKTLKWHIHNIYKKLQADNRTEALNNYFGQIGN